MVDVVQLVRASDCGSECRRFESGLPPNKNPCKLNTYEGFLFSGGGHANETELRGTVIRYAPPGIPLGV